MSADANTSRLKSERLSSPQLNFGLPRIGTALQPRAMTTTSTARVRFWHFQCPECGIGDQEIGALAEGHDIYCEVCLTEKGRHVRLTLSPAEDSADAIEAAQRECAA